MTDSAQELRVKCPSCSAIGVALNFEGKTILECGSCKYVITRSELESYTLNSTSVTTCPPNCNGECADDQAERNRLNPIELN